MQIPENLTHDATPFLQLVWMVKSGIAVLPWNLATANAMPYSQRHRQGEGRAIQRIVLRECSCSGHHMSCSGIAGNEMSRRTDVLSFVLISFCSEISKAIVRLDSPRFMSDRARLTVWKLLRLGLLKRGQGTAFSVAGFWGTNSAAGCGSSRGGNRINQLCFEG